MGPYLKILNMDAVVAGSKVLRVDDLALKVWELKFSYRQDDGIKGHYTWLYDKRTGLLLAVTWIEWNGEGNVIGTWGGHLTSTNVVLERK